MANRGACLHIALLSYSFLDLVFQITRQFEALRAEQAQQKLDDAAAAKRADERARTITLK